MVHTILYWLKQVSQVCKIEALLNYSFVLKMSAFCVCCIHMYIQVDFRQDFFMEANSSITRVHIQGSHRLEKYLNLEGFLEKPLKTKSAWKNTGKSLKSLEKSLNSTIFCRT